MADFIKYQDTFLQFSVSKEIIFKSALKKWLISKFGKEPTNQQLNSIWANNQNP